LHFDVIHGSPSLVLPDIMTMIPGMDTATILKPDQPLSPTLFDPETVTLDGELLQILYWASYRDGFRSWHRTPSRESQIGWLVGAGMLELFRRPPNRRYVDGETSHRITDFGREVLERSRAALDQPA
jgi:hypothetical protein